MNAPAAGAGRGALLGMTLANALALLAAAGAAALYARWLDAAQLAHWAAALALARAGVLLLDGGLKTALVRRALLPDAAALRRLGGLLMAAAVVLSAVLALLAWGLWQGGRLGGGAALLLAVYPAAYLLAYGPLLGALVELERGHRFGAVARAEGASVVVEFVLPVLLMSGGTPYWAAFALGAVAARALRSVWIVRAARGVCGEHAGHHQTTGTRLATLLREGLGVQAVAALAMLRDTTHLWLLGPWFGAQWAGAYTLALMACTLVGQASAQAAARVALPLLRSTPAAAQWPQLLAQTRWLALCSLPPLMLLPAWLAHADAAWWGGRWPELAAIAPWLAARMVASVATTTLGALLMATQNPWHSARAHAAWTACELIAAGLAMRLLGPLGLAVAGALTPWVGMLLFTAAAAPTAPLRPRLVALFGLLLRRPSLWIAVALALLAQGRPALLWAVTLALPLAWLSERSLRQWLRWTLLPALQSRLARRPLVHP